MAERMAVWSVLTEDDWERVRNRIIVNVIRHATIGTTGQARDVTDAVVDFVNLGRPENLKSKLRQATDKVTHFDGLNLLRAAVNGNWSATAPLNYTDFIQAPAAFIALFDALDFYLPIPVEQDFVFTAYKPELITTRATNIVTARRLAAEQLGAGIRFDNGDLTPKPPVDTSVPASVLAALERFDKGDPTWHFDGAGHWSIALADSIIWAKANGKLIPQFSDTTIGYGILKELFGLNKPAVPTSVLEAIAQYDGGRSAWTDVFSDAQKELVNAGAATRSQLSTTTLVVTKAKAFYGLPPIAAKAA
jgi:hypothetical protein